MNIKVLFLGLLSVLILSSFIEHENANPTYHFVQFKIHNLTTVEQANTVTKHLAQYPEVIAPRIDYINGVFFCYMTSDAMISEARFTEWFKAINFKISCFNTGIEGKDKGIPHESIKNCE